MIFIVLYYFPSNIKNMYDILLKCFKRGDNTKEPIKTTSQRKKWQQHRQHGQNTNNNHKLKRRSNINSSMHRDDNRCSRRVISSCYNSGLCCVAHGNLSFDTSQIWYAIITFQNILINIVYNTKIMHIRVHYENANY